MDKGLANKIQLPKKESKIPRGIRGWKEHPKAFLRGLMSFFIPGLGQLRNKQWYKAIPFFLLFGVALVVELATSRYFLAAREIENYPIVTVDMMEGGSFYGQTRTEGTIINGHFVTQAEIQEGGDYFGTNRQEGNFVLEDGLYVKLMASDVAAGGDYENSPLQKGDVVGDTPYALTSTDVASGGEYFESPLQAGDVTKIKLKNTDVTETGRYYQSYREAGDLIKYLVVGLDTYAEGAYYQTERQIGDIIKYVLTAEDVAVGGAYAGTGKAAGDFVYIPLTAGNLGTYAGDLSSGDILGGTMLTADSTDYLEVGDLVLREDGTYLQMVLTQVSSGGTYYQVERKTGDIISADGITAPVLLRIQDVCAEGRFYGDPGIQSGDTVDILLTAEDVAEGGDFYQSYRQRNDTFFVLIDPYDIIPNRIDELIEQGIYSAVLGVQPDNVADRIYFFRDYGGWFTRGIWGLITLGELPTEVDNNAVWYRGWQMIVAKSANQASYPDWVVADNSTTLMTNGVITMVLMLILILLWVMNFRDAYVSCIQIDETGVIEAPKAFLRRFWDQYFAYLIVIPTFILIAFFTLIPFAFSFMTSFTSWNSNIAVPSELIDWEGFVNFREVFTGTNVNLKYFGTVFLWTLEFAILASVTCYVLGLIQALIIQSKSVIAKRFWRTVFILPWAIPSLVTLLMFRNIFSAEGGLANQVIDSLSDPNYPYVLIQQIKSLLSAFGLFAKETSVYAAAGNFWDKILIFFKVLGFGGRDAAEAIYSKFSAEYIGWFEFSNFHLGRFLIIIINLWIGYPYFMLLITGTLTSIPADMYEAADIDGATNWQKIKYITLPWILRATTPVIITTLTHNFNNFGVIYFLTGSTPAVTYKFLADGTMSSVGAPNSAPSIYDILISWVYRLAMLTTIREYNIAAVYSIIIFVIVGIFSVYNLSRMKSFWEED